MALDPTKDGHLRVTLSSAGVKVRYMVHRLQAEAFLGPSGGRPVVRHLNDIPWDNRISNLEWGTFAENIQDAVLNKTHRNSQKTSCSKGHPYDEQNTVLFRGYQRRCLTCSRRWSREAYRRRTEKGSNGGTKATSSS